MSALVSLTYGASLDLGRWHRAPPPSLACPHCGLVRAEPAEFGLGNVRIEGFAIEYDGMPVDLGRTQFLIVERLVRARGRPLTRDFLAASLETEVLDEAICQYVRRARAAFRRVDPGFDQIETLRGFGAYRWKHRLSRGVRTVAND